MNHVGSSVNLCIVNNNKILMMRRISKRWMDGKLQVPGGHTEQSESPLQAVLREANEELGITIGPDDVELIATVAVKDDDNEYFALAFQLLKPARFQFRIVETEKCSELVWVDVNNLPADTIELFQQVIHQNLIENKQYIEVGY